MQTKLENGGDKRTQVSFIGDSTIDNRVWVDGLVASFLKTRLGIKRNSSFERVEQYRHCKLKPKLSVIENMMAMLPDYTIHDLTNDGFTTTDCLYGQYRDKVFGVGNFSLFPHEFFSPLADGAKHIKTSDYIVISLGGNDFREFLKTALQKKGDDRVNYIKTNFYPVMHRFKKQYLEILKKVQELNPDAQIILMTQYYPSTTQNSYKVYPFMQELGKTLDLTGPNYDPMNVIQEIMKQSYTDIFKLIPKHNIVVADITSSLNPFINKNHVHQIEPSGRGGKKIAQMLRYIMTSKQVVSGQCYRFYSEFFNSKEQDKHVEGVDMQQWKPAHPTDLKANEAGFFRNNRQKSLAKTLSHLTEAGNVGQIECGGSWRIKKN